MLLLIVTVVKAWTFDFTLGLLLLDDVFKATVFCLSVILLGSSLIHLMLMIKVSLAFKLRIELRVGHDRLSWNVPGVWTTILLSSRKLAWSGCLARA